MNKTVLFVFLFLGLIFLQIFFLNKLDINEFIFPQAYILFILLLPIHLHYFWHMLLGFMLGISIDIFTDTIGIHAFVAVFISYIKLPVLNYIIKSDNYDTEHNTPLTFRFGSFYKYCFMLVLTFHAILFMIWDLGYDRPFVWLIKTCISSLISILIMLLIYLFVKEKKYNF